MSRSTQTGEMNDNIWVERGMDEVEAIRNTPLPEMEVKITEDDVPF